MLLLNSYIDVELRSILLKNSTTSISKAVAWTVLQIQVLEYESKRILSISPITDPLHAVIRLVFSLLYFLNKRALLKLLLMHYF